MPAGPTCRPTTSRASCGVTGGEDDQPRRVASRPEAHSLKGANDRSRGNSLAPSPRNPMGQKPDDGTIYIARIPCFRAVAHDNRIDPSTLAATRPLARASPGETNDRDSTSAVIGRMAYLPVTALAQQGRDGQRPLSTRPTCAVTPLDRTTRTRSSRRSRSRSWKPLRQTASSGVRGGSRIIRATNGNGSVVKYRSLSTMTADD